MTPQMIAALASGRATLTAFFEIALPSGTRRLLFGSTEVDWNGNTWVGYDPTIGSIAAPDDVSEDMTGEAPNTSLTIALAPGVNRDDVAGGDIQLSPLKIWLVALELDGDNRVQVVPDPDLQFDGFVDQATLTLDANRDELEYTVISAFDYFFEDGEGQRLNGQFHQVIWPSEKGLDNITGVTKKIYWGMYGPSAGPVGGAGNASLDRGGLAGRGDVRIL